MADGTDIKSYGLPVKRVEDTKNYLPVQKEQFWSLEATRQGEESGTTQTKAKPGHWQTKRS